MTEATPLASEQITQADEDATEAYLNFSKPDPANYIGGGGPSIRLWNRTAQAFARHRIAALSASPAPSGQGVSGEVERASPRPWQVVPYGDGDSLVIHDARGEWRVCFMATPGDSAGAAERIEANANLIVAAVNAYAPVSSCAPGEVERIVLDMDFANTPPIDWSKHDWSRLAAALSPQGLDAATVEQVKAALRAEIDAPLTGPTHGAWDRGRIGGLRDAIKTITALATEPHQHGGKGA